MLKQFFRFIELVRPGKVYGFNICFDLRWVLLRALKYKINLPIDFRSKAIDLRKTLSLGDYKAKGTLNDYARYLYLGSKLGENGKKAIELWEKNKTKELEQYCLQDVRLTRKLLEKMTEIGIA